MRLHGLSELAIFLPQLNSPQRCEAGPRIRKEGGYCEVFNGEAFRLVASRTQADSGRSTCAVGSQESCCGEVRREGGRQVFGQEGTASQCA
jgi:hypothetical protein